MGMIVRWKANWTHLRLNKIMITPAAASFGSRFVRDRLHGPRLLNEFLSTMLAAKVIRLSIPDGLKRGRFVYLHSANRIFGHC